MTPTRFAPLAALLLLAAPAFAATDLENDLKTPFEPLSNPFTHSVDRALSKRAQAELKEFVLRCLVRPVKEDSNQVEIDDEARVRAECAGETVYTETPDARTGRPTIDPRVEIHSGSLDLIAVSWDGDNSDGGDELALGIYTTDGTRIAVYRSLYLEGDTFDGLAAALGLAREIPHVQDPSLKID
jgi:hypothetical protein